MDKGLEFSINEDSLKLLTSSALQIRTQIEIGGGRKKQEKIKSQGKLTARERIAKLVDVDSNFLELGTFAAYGMYKEYGGCPAAGVVCGIGKVNGRDCAIVANDPSVKAGAWFPMSGKKNLRIQDIAMENRIPIIYLVDSAGIFLPLQEEIFADAAHFGRVFRNNARMSKMGITQIALLSRARQKAL